MKKINSFFLIALFTFAITSLGLGQVNYTMSRFSTTYNELSVGGGATQLIGGVGTGDFSSSSGTLNVDDGTAYIPLPFNFTYNGVAFNAGTNFLGICSNGFIYPSTVNTNASKITTTTNTNMYSTSTPNNTIAPYFDDLDLGLVVGVDSGQCLYQTFAADAGDDDTLVVQYKVFSYFSTSAGNPVLMRFQVWFFKNSGVIEFRYGGTVSGTTTNTAESANIGLEDATGGNGRYLDAFTGSAFSNVSMLNSRNFNQIKRHFRFTPGAPSVLAGGTYNVGVGQTYINLNEAVSDMNHRGISGAVTLNLTDNTYDSTDANGNNLFPLVVGPVTGNSAVNTINISKSSGTATLVSPGHGGGNIGNQASSSLLSTTSEPIVAVFGADYLTLRNLTLTGISSTNLTIMPDRGLGVYNSSATDGAQFGTFRDITVNLSRTNTSSIGIHQQTATTPTTKAGTNSVNSYLNCGVKNSYAGMYLESSTTSFAGAGHDSSNVINTISGGTSYVGDVLTSNDIGNGASTTYGIRIRSQRDVTVSNTTVQNVTVTGAVNVDGILCDSAIGNSTISNNTITGIKGTSTTSTARICGMNLNSGKAIALTQTLNVFNNSINNLTTGYTSTATGSRSVRGFYLQLNGTGTTSTINLWFNSVRIDGTANISNACVEIGTTSGPVFNVRDNSFGNFTGDQLSPARHNIIASSSNTLLGNTGTAFNYNDYYFSNTLRGYISIGSTDSATTLATHQSKYTGQDANTINANPNYASTTDLRPLAGSPLLNAGTPIGSVLVDQLGVTRSVTTPTIGAYEASVNIGPIISYTVLGNTTNTGNRNLNAVSITDVDGVAGGANAPRVYWKVGANGSYSSAATASGSSPYDFLIGVTGLAVGDTVMYYVIAQDGLGAVSSSPSTGLVASNVNTVTTHPTSPNKYIILGSISGTYEVGTDQTTLKKLTNVSAHLLGNVITGNLIYELNSTYDGTTGETFPIVLSTVNDDGGMWTVTIRPKSGAGARSTVGSSSTDIIQLDGADRVTLDGREGGAGTTIAWSLENTVTTASSDVIRLNATTSSCVRNTIKYLNIKAGVSVVTSANSTCGINIGTAYLTTGTRNDSTTISNNNITKCRVGIFAGGISAANPDLDLMINNNVIGASSFGTDAIGAQGMIIANQQRPTITQNEIRYIGGTFGNITSFADRCGIAFVFSTSPIPVGANTTFIANAKVTRNLIHDIVDEQTGSASAIQLGGTDGTNFTNNEISNNVIYNIKANGTSGDYTSIIGVGAGKGDVIAYNSIYSAGDLDPNASASAPTQRSLAIDIQVSTVNTLTLKNNAVYTNLFSSSTPSLDAFCINVPTGFVFATNTNSSDYNLFFPGSDTNNSVGTNGGTAGTQIWKNISDWRTAFSVDASTIQGNPGFTSTTDLSIDANSSNAWNVSGMGQPLSSISIDYNNTARSTTVSGGATDIGAYNVTPLSTPPTATASGAPAPSTTTTYTLNGRNLGSITWGPGGTVPSSVTFQFFPGANPPNSGGFNVANGYWVITVPDGSGFSYDLVLNYNPAQLGTVPADTNVIIAKSEDGGTTYTPYLVYGTGAGEYERNSAGRYITIHGLTSFSLFGLGDNNAPLPVELASFTANVDRRNVSLKWMTASEENNAGFDIERKLASSEMWSKIGSVSGNGTSNSAHNYNYEDRNLVTGKYNYRLKQIDNNGNFKYHTLTGMVDVGVPTKFDMSQNYPNPFNPTTKINYDLPFDSKVSIKLFDMSGREVAQIVNATQTAGYYTAQFNASNLASGVYFYNIIAEGGNAAKFITTKKMVLVK